MADSDGTDGVALVAVNTETEARCMSSLVSISDSLIG